MADSDRSEQEIEQDIDAHSQKFQMKNQIYELKSKLHNAEYGQSKISLAYAGTIKELRQQIYYLQLNVKKLSEQKHLYYMEQEETHAMFETLKAHNNELSEEITALKADLEALVSENRMTPNFQEGSDQSELIKILLQKDEQILKLKGKIESSITNSFGVERDSVELEERRAQERKAKDEATQKKIMDLQKSNKLREEQLRGTQEQVARLQMELNRANQQQKSLIEAASQAKKALGERERVALEKQRIAFEKERVIERLSQQVASLHSSMRPKDDGLWENQCLKLRREKDSLEQFNKYLESSAADKNRQLEKEIKTLERLLNEARAGTMNDKMEITRMTGELTRIAGELAENERVVQDYNIQISQFSQLSLQISELINGEAGKRTRHEGWQEQVSFMKQNVQKLKEDLFRIRDENSRLKAENSAVRSERSTLKTEISALKAQTSTYKGEINALKTQISTLVSKYEKKCEKLMGVQNEIRADYDSRVKQLQREIYRLTEQATPKHAPQGSKHAPPDTPKTELKLREQLDVLNTKLELMSFERAETKEKNARLASNLEQKEGTVRSQKEAIAVLERELRDARRDLQDLQLVHQELREKYQGVMRLEGDIRQMNEELAREKGNQERYMRELKEFEGLKEGKAQKEREVMELRQELQCQIQQAERNRQDSVGMRDDNRILREQIGGLKEEIKALKQREQSNTIRGLLETITALKEDNKPLKDESKLEMRLARSKVLDTRKVATDTDMDTRLKELEATAQRQRCNAHEFRVKLASAQNQLSRRTLQLSLRDEQIRRLNKESTSYQYPASYSKVSYEKDYFQNTYTYRENPSLEQKVRELEREVQGLSNVRLTDKVGLKDELERRISTLQQQRSQLMSEKSQLMSEKSQLMSEKSQLMSEKRHTDKVNQELAKKVSELEMENEQLKENLKDALKETNQILLQQKELKRRNPKQDELKAAHQQIQRLSKLLLERDDKCKYPINFEDSRKRDEQGRRRQEETDHRHTKTTARLLKITEVHKFEDSHSRVRTPPITKI